MAKIILKDISKTQSDIRKILWQRKLLGSVYEIISFLDIYHLNQLVLILQYLDLALLAPNI